MLAQWCVADADLATRQALVAATGLSPLLCQVLINRGMTDAAAARTFLTPSLHDLHDPYGMHGMEPAVQRLVAAIRQGERIAIYGDYDVDGVTSTAMLFRALRALKANVDWHIPHRVQDGYGVNSEAIRAAASQRTSLIVTVDCGISAVEQVALARELGMDVIITDHHEPPPVLPQALAVLNPKLPDSPYPFKELAGVGVGFKLLTALVREVSPQHEASLQRAFLDLVALGTIADMAPLIDENRIFAKLGLEQLRETKSVGLQALMQVSGIGKRSLTPRDVGFGLGPRLNAGGRLDTARQAALLLITRDAEEAMRLAQDLDTINRERQEEEAHIVEQAKGKIGFDYDLSQCAIVLGSADWHVGVVGIAASRIVEQFHRPTILLSVEGDTARGSGRSIEAFHLFKALEECQELLLRFGGHKLAAGLALRVADLSSFQARFCEIAARALTPEELVPTLHIDAEINATELSEALLNELEQLGPFGIGNPRPQFAIRNAAIVNADSVGGGSHLKLRVKSSNRYYDALWWRKGERLSQVQTGSQADLCFTPEFNDFNGYRTIQFTLKDVRLP